MGGVFVAQLGSARSLAEIQQRFVNEQLKQAASAPSSRYSAHQLIDETAGFVKAELAASLKEVRDLIRVRVRLGSGLGQGGERPG